MFPDKINERSNNLFLQICKPVHDDTILKQKAYMNLTGRFPHILSRGTSYFLVMYDFDTNAILIEPLRTRQAGKIIKAFKNVQIGLQKKWSYLKSSLWIMNVQGI